MHSCCVMYMVAIVYKVNIQDLSQAPRNTGSLDRSGAVNRKKKRHTEQNLLNSKNQ